MASKHRAAESVRQDWSSQQRAAWITLFLFKGSRLSNPDVARLCGMKRRGAQSMMETLSATLPIVQDEGGRWMWMQKDE